MSPHFLPIAIVVVAIAAACSKEPPPPKPQASGRTVAPQPVAPAGAPAPGQIDEALKDRLARQEAAARMFEKNVLQPAPPKSTLPAGPDRPTAGVAPEKSGAQLPKLAAKRPEPEPAKVEPPKPAATPVPAAATPAPAPASQPVAPPPRTDLAAARPAPAPESGAIRLLSRTDPEFPREAVQAGVDQGSVKARMTLDGSGSVTRVEILESNPRRVFDRAVIRSLSQWRYNDGAAGRTVDMEVAFRR